MGCRFDYIAEGRPLLDVNNFAREFFSGDFYQISCQYHHFCISQISRTLLLYIFIFLPELLITAHKIFNTQKWVLQGFGPIVEREKWRQFQKTLL
eukprot:c19790_g2_i1 orf=14-298(-)